MDKDLARTVLPLVNDVDTHNRLCTYAYSRINSLRDQLELPATNVEALRGAIAELRLILRLRDDAQRDSR